jgi:hypothetical protein
VVKPYDYVQDPPISRLWSQEEIKAAANELNQSISSYYAPDERSTIQSANSPFPAETARWNSNAKMGLKLTGIAGYVSGVPTYVYKLGKLPVVIMQAPRARQSVKIGLVAAHPGGSGGVKRWLSTWSTSRREKIETDSYI